jgi:DNA polymerase-3 subunit beta
MRGRWKGKNYINKRRKRMIFNYNKASLEKVLKNIEPIIPTKSVKPISECILLELNGNILTITATDLSFTNQSVIEVVGIEDGFAIVDGKRFITIVRSFPQGNIKFTKDSNSEVILSLNRIKQTISSLENKLSLFVKSLTIQL